MIANPPAPTSETTGQLLRAIAAQLASLDEKPLAPGLYLVATPIGNLSDITLRALHVLANVGAIYCEDTRQTRKLTERYGLPAHLKPYHEHNADRERPRVVAELKSGAAVALVSDAGTPLVSDPGHKLVREAQAASIPVHAIPGPSAVLAGLSVSGLEIDRFFFEGFLPSRAAARRERVGKLREVPGTLVFYEAPGRVAATLSDLAAVLGPRPAAVTRELTKLHEEHRFGPLTELAEMYADATPRGEFVLLVGPPAKSADVDDASICKALSGLLDSMSLRDASRELAEHYGVSRKRVYELGLDLTRRDGPS